MSYNLFLDDLRKPSDVYWVTYPDNIDWTVVRNYNEFVREVDKRKELPALVTFDHDLCEAHYFTDFENPDIYKHFIQSEFTGYHCVRWMIEYCKRAGLAFPKRFFHTLNPKGLGHMQELVERYEKQQLSDI